MYLKRGQVSVFVVLGIVIIVIILSMLYVRLARISVLTDSDIADARQYAEECLEESLRSQYLGYSPQKNQAISNDNIELYSSALADMIDRDSELIPCIKTYKSLQTSTIGSPVSKVAVKGGHIRGVPFPEISVTTSLNVKITKGESSTNLREFYAELR
jgi:hypothetical protein